MKKQGTKPRSSPLGRSVQRGLKEALAHARGEIELPSYQPASVPKLVDVARLRTRLGLSQAKFAERFGFDVTAVHAWEQHRRMPGRAARILLQVIDREPAAVLRAIGAV
ncbi:MAG: helix-turn-helix domain-containing protein [Alphaproteobacteria bacterium]|nr:MAG: helix-turn-helix domain-containing protein [Alphaproteobacteria bacterium]